MADEAALTTDAAIDALNAQDEPEAVALGDDTPRKVAWEDEDQPAGAQEAAADEIEDEADLPAADDAEPDEDGDGDDEIEPDQPAIDPPHSWDAEAKADFAQLPRALQEKTLAREQQRDAAVGQAMERAATAEKTASMIDQFGQVLDQLVPHAQSVFGDRWDDVDWTTLADTEPNEYWRLRALRDEEAGELQRLQAAQEAARFQQQQRFIANRNAQLPAIVPELFDPQQGQARQVELSSYLTNAGIPAPLISQADAAMIGIAWKALQFDKAQASARANVANPKPRPSQSARPVRPAASPETGSIKQIRAAKASQRLRQSGSIDDAVAFLNAQD